MWIQAKIVTNAPVHGEHSDASPNSVVTCTQLFVLLDLLKVLSRYGSLTAFWAITLCLLLITYKAT